MNKQRTFLLFAGLAVLTSLAVGGMAEAGPIGDNIAPSQVQPTNDKTKGKKANGRAASRLIAGPGTKPADGVLAPRPDVRPRMCPRPRTPGLVMPG